MRKYSRAERTKRCRGHKSKKVCRSDPNCDYIRGLKTRSGKVVRKGSCRVKRKGRIYEGPTLSDY